MKRILDGDLISMLECRDLSIKNLMNGLFGGNRRSGAYGESGEFADYREYEKGDDLKKIDWNLYQRFEKLYLKLCTDERQLHHRIYFDTSASMAWGEPSKAYTALRLGAALGYLAVQAMDRVSFYAIEGGKCRDICRTVLGREAFYSAASELEGLEFSGASDIGEAIIHSTDTGYANGMSVIISDFFTDSDYKGAVDSLINKKREVHLIRVLSRDEISPDVSGKLVLVDPEDRSLDYRSEFTRASLDAYREAVEYCTEELRNFALSRSVGFVDVVTDEKIDKMLFEKAVAEGVII